jgi:hypothetical protein
MNNTVISQPQGRYVAPREAEETSDEALSNSLFYSVIEHADLAASWARSAAESAWRGERTELRYYLTQMRLTTIGAISAFKQLGSVNGDAA